MKDSTDDEIFFKKRRIESLRDSRVISYPTTPNKGSIHINRHAAYKDYTPEQFVKEIFINSGSGACVTEGTISNVKFYGAAWNSTTAMWLNDDRSLSYFANGKVGLGMEDGLLLATGGTLNVEGPNESEGALGSGGVNLSQDSDLAPLVLPNKPTTGSVLEFDFIPNQSQISFEYIFASEEYPEFVNESVNDVFGFFVTDLVTNIKENIAVLPDSDPPIPITINTVNGGKTDTNTAAGYLSAKESSNPQYFVPNYEFGDYMEYDGRTVILKAIANVIPGRKYRLKLAISNVQDNSYGSGVFLKAGSFDLGLGIINHGNNIENMDNVFQNCQNNKFIINVAKRNVPTVVALTYSGAAVNDIRQPNGTVLPATITIPANTTSYTINYKVQSTITTNGGAFNIRADVAGCGTLEKTLKVYSSFTSAKTVTTASCSGNDGAIYVTATGGTTTNLEMSKDNGVNWQKIGTPFKDLAPGTYKIKVRDNGSCQLEELTAIVHAKPTIAENLSNKVACVGEQVAQIALTSIVPNTTFAWQVTGASIGLASGSGAKIPAFTVTANGVATVKVTPTANGCTGTPKSFTITANRLATAADITATGATICVGDKANLTASSSLGTPIFRWYDSATSTVALHTGAAYTPAPTSTKTYYVSVSGNGVCENATSARKAVTVTVNRLALATDITVADVIICAGDKANLSATSSLASPVFRWYDSATSTAALHTGAAYTPAPTSTKTYYVSVSGNGVCENATSARKAVKVTVNRLALATDITAAGATICAGDNANLTATSGLTSPVFRWYDSATSTVVLHTGATYTPSPASTKTYYVSVSATGICENATSARKAVTVTVNRLALAGDITAAGATICAGDNANLIATSGLTSPVFRWYDSATSTVVLHTGATYTPSPASTKTYFVSVSATGICENATSARKAVTVTVNRLALAGDITATGATICAGDNANLIATSGLTSPVFRWYDSATSTVVLHTGATYTPSPASTKAYYVSVSATGICENAISARKAVTVTVNRLATAADITANNSTICYNSKVTLTASSTVVGATFSWYDTQTSTTALATGATFTSSANLTATRKYYVSVTGTSICENATSARKEVTVTVRPQVIVGAISGNPSVCANTTPQTIIGVASTGGSASFTYEWESSTNGTSGWTKIQLAASGKDYTPTVQTGDVYYRRISIDPNCDRFISNTFKISEVEEGIKFTWKSNATDNDWNKPENWINSKNLPNIVPTICSEVHIPYIAGVTPVYPALDGHTETSTYGAPSAGNIIFHQGGQISFPHKLTYNKAFVQYNWKYYNNTGLTPSAQPSANSDNLSSYLKRDVWHMLAVPLKNMVSGDFALAGYPMTWQAQFKATQTPTNGGAILGDFSSPITENNKELSKTYNAIAIKVPTHNMTIGNGQKNLEGLKGIMEMPYWDNSSISAFRPGHLYDPISGVSTFFYYDTKTLQQLGSPVGKQKRGDETYRFIYETGTGAVPTIPSLSGVAGYTLPINSPSQRAVMIGNPYMSSINAKKFLDANAAKLKSAAGYYVFAANGTNWLQYQYNLGNNIGPLQAFVVTLADGVTVADLYFPLEGTYALTDANYRGSSRIAPESSSLLVALSANRETSDDSYAILEGISDKENMKKIFFTEGHKTPEVFYIEPSDNDYNLVQTYKDANSELNLGIRSSDTNSELTLKFDNVNQFVMSNNVHPVLIDKYAGVKQDLSVYNTYKFRQQSGRLDSQYTDANRFEVRLMTEADFSDDRSIVIRYHEQTLTVESMSNLKTISVFDLAGNVIYQIVRGLDNINYYQKMLPLSSGVYIVTAQTADGRKKTEKIIVSN